MFVRKKSFTNRDGSKRVYAQICHSRRVDGVSKHDVLFDLGRIDLPEGKAKLNEVVKILVNASEDISFLDVMKDLKAHDALEYGPHYIFSKLWKNLGLETIFKSEFRQYETEFDVCKAIYNMTLNRLTAPSSKRALEPWQENMFDISRFDTHQYYRAMDYLIEHKESVEKKLFDRQRDLFNQSVDVVLFDTTTLVYYGKGPEDEHEELLAKGFSKAHRGDLNQVVVGVLVSKEGIPLGHEVFAGNKNDVTCFKEIIDKVSSKFKVSKVVLVGDRGMINDKNLRLLDDKKYEYILGYRMRTIKKTDRAQVLSKANLKKIKKDCLQCCEVEYKGRRLIVFYNPERAETDAKKRRELIEQINEKLKSKDVKSLISNSSFKKFITIDAKAPKLDLQKVKDDAIYDGVFVITSNTKLKPLEVVNGYRDLWQVEMAFRQLKSELKMGPMFHHKDRRIRAHIMICFMALMMRSHLYRQLKKKYKHASYPKVLNDMKSMKVVELDIKNEKILVRTETKKGFMQAVNSLKMKSPPRILSNHSVKQILQ